MQDREADGVEDTGGKGVFEVPEAEPPKEAATADLEAKTAELEDRLLRALAEQENIRMRARRDLATAVSFAASGFAKDLLATADNLRRALESAPQTGAEDDAMRRMLIGIEATERGLLSAFEKHGIRRAGGVGEKLDPNFHEVIQEISGSGEPEGTIVQLLQPGYLHHDRLLRPAMVAVARGTPKPKPASGESASDTNGTEE